MAGRGRGEGRAGEERKREEGGEGGEGGQGSAKGWSRRVSTPETELESNSVIQLNEFT